MNVVTGAAGFIGSCLVGKLSTWGKNDLVLVDDFRKSRKGNNLSDKKFLILIDRNHFEEWLRLNGEKIDIIYHIGARTDTTETDADLLNRLNLGYTKMVWRACSKYNIPLVYASSAATYGNGELGYDDRHDVVPCLQPLNLYGKSKNDFDIWALKQEKCPPKWYGLKFFNVYGPNEYHKDRMASVIFHAYNQIKSTGKVKLFRSHKPDCADGMQMRDFIYVKDIVELCAFMAQTLPKSGLYNAGTGKAQTFSTLAHAVFDALNTPPNIKFMDIPVDIRNNYQYFTEANMHKMRQAGYTQPFVTLRDGVRDYVTNYLEKNAYF